MGLSWGSRPDHVLGPFAAPDPASVDELMSDSAGADEDGDDDDDEDMTVQWDDSAIVDSDVDELLLDAPGDEDGSTVSHAPLHRSLSAPFTFRSFTLHQGFDPVVGDIVVSHERETA